MDIPAGGATKTLSTKAYEAYVHLKEGSIVPMQNGYVLCDTYGLRTVKELKDHPIQAIVNPACVGGVCTSKGSYYTDDGDVLDNTGKVNSYDFSLNSADRSKLVLSVNWNMQADSKTMINKNDEMETVRIYNANLWGFNGSWTVQVNFKNGTTTTLNDAAYDANWDAIEFDIDQTKWPDNIELWKVDNVTFTKK
jgi:hypothetical protein